MRNNRTAAAIDAHQAFERLFKPPSSSFSEHELKLLEKADNIFMTHDRRTMALYVWGKGPTVLLVHGWGSRGAVFADFVWPLVESGYRVVAFDVPAHGRSGGTYANHLVFRDAILAVSARENPLHAIIAHSIGAVATILALGRGLRVGRVVLLACSPWFSAVVKAFLSSFNMSKTEEEAFIRLIKERLGKDDWEPSTGNRILRGLNVPGLVIHDRQDRDVPVEHGMAIARAWPGARLITTDGLGHRKILNDPQVIEEALGFIKG